MFTIKNDQALLHFLLNKIIKEPETSFQAPVLNKNMLEMFVIQYIII